MPTTLTGQTVYADPDELRLRVQTEPDDVGKTINTPPNTGDPDDWDSLLAQLHAAAKTRIDEYCQRDFEDHPNETIELSGGEGGTGVLPLPAPVRSVQEVRITDEPLDSDSWYAKDTGQLVYTGGGAGAAAVGYGPYGNPDGSGLRARDHRPRGRQWPPGYGNIHVDLTYGYETAPRDIQSAELQLAGNALAGLAQKREGTVVQHDEFDISVLIPTALNKELRRMLNPHVRNEVFN